MPVTRLGLAQEAVGGIYSAEHPVGRERVNALLYRDTKYVRHSDCSQVPGPESRRKRPGWVQDAVRSGTAATPNMYKSGGALDCLPG